MSGLLAGAELCPVLLTGLFFVRSLTLGPRCKFIPAAGGPVLKAGPAGRRAKDPLYGSRDLRGRATPCRSGPTALWQGGRWL